LILASFFEVIDGLTAVVGGRLEGDAVTCRFLLSFFSLEDVVVVVLRCSKEQNNSRSQRMFAARVLRPESIYSVRTLMSVMLPRSAVAASFMYEHGAIFPFPASLRKPK
jgi:hypothetical protein